MSRGEGQYFSRRQAQQVLGLAGKEDNSLAVISVIEGADADGIIVVPLKDAPEVLEAAGKFHEQDAAKVEAARNGTSNRAWVRKKLEEKKTEFIDGMYGE